MSLDGPESPGREVLASVPDEAAQVLAERADSDDEDVAAAVEEALAMAQSLGGDEDENDEPLR